MKYSEMLTLASNGELTADNINDIVLAMNDVNQARDKREKDNAEKLAKHERSIRDIEEESTLLPAEADDISLEVKKKGVEVMGGKKSAAYKNKDLRQRVYRDIYGVVKREYGLINERGGQMSYKKMKRKYIASAIDVIKLYTPPMALEEEIESVNDLGDMEE